MTLLHDEPMDDNDDLLMGDFHWPTSKVNILAGGNDDRHHAFLDWQRNMDLSEFGYISGFKLAAEVMYKHIEETGRDQDRLVFPFGMCWRHHIELQLKSLLAELKRFQGEPTEGRPTHNLAKLWNQVRARLEVVRPHDTEDLDTVEALLRQLHDVDRTNEEFRYPIKNDDTPSLSNVPRVDLAAFHEAMLGLSSFFSAANTAVYEEAQTRAEIEQEMQGEADDYQAH